jgi:hypothetical protein
MLFLAPQSSLPGPGLVEAEQLRVYPLSELAATHERSQSGWVQGKIVIDVVGTGDARARGSSLVVPMRLWITKEILLSHSRPASALIGPAWPTWSPTPCPVTPPTDEDAGRRNPPWVSSVIVAGVDAQRQTQSLHCVGRGVRGRAVRANRQRTVLRAGPSTAGGIGHGGAGLRPVTISPQTLRISARGVYVSCSESSLS